MSNTEDSYGHQNSFCELQYYEIPQSGSHKLSEGTQFLYMHKEVPVMKRNNVIRNTAVTYGYIELFYYPLSYGVPVRERYGSTLLPATREQHDQNCTQSH